MFRLGAAAQEKLLSVSQYVVNSKDLTGADLGADNVLFVGRQSRWGNPDLISDKMTREQVVCAYWHRVAGFDPAKRREWLTPIADCLRLGGVLRCFCAPELCHAMVLAYWVLYHPEFEEYWALHRKIQSEMSADPDLADVERVGYSELTILE